MRPPLLSRINVIVALCLAVAGALASAGTWAYGRGTTEAEVEARILAAEVRVQATEAAIQRHDYAIEITPQRGAKLHKALSTGDLSGLSADDRAKVEAMPDRARAMLAAHLEDR
jgi:hypothetical protein